MFEALLATTSTEGLQPLGSAPQRSYELVSGAVRERLGAEHAAIFAEPVAAQHGDSIDWHAPLQGRAERLADLGEEEQAALRARLGALVGDIRAAAEALKDSDAPNDQRLAEALGNALEIPGEEMIWAVRDPKGALHPVLVHWAWVRDDQRAVRGVLSAMVARPAAAAPLPPPVEARRGLGVWWWLILLGWLVLAALLAAILYLLVAPCGVNQRGLIFCPVAPPERAAAMSQAHVAGDEVAALERELALVDRQCHPTVPVLPVTPPEPAPAPEEETNAAPTEADREAAARRIAERGARRGNLNFTLEWATLDDIDLYVTCPTGATVSYKNRGDCNGTYDLDANVKRAEAITDPVENIVFDDNAPLGIYKVRAHLRSERTEGAKRVVLHVLRRDGPSQSYQGMVGAGQDEWTTVISISR